MGAEIILRNHFPNALINIGIAKKKIIRNAHGIDMALYSRLFSISSLGWASSVRVVPLYCCSGITGSDSKLFRVVPGYI